jgi:hypothetical protein
MPLNTSVRLDRPYVADASVDERRDSALRLIQQMLALRDVLSVHHSELLSIGLWKWTEASGVAPHAKYHVPLRSYGAIDLATPASINHEHVWPRKWMVDQLLQRQDWTAESLRQFLETYGVACVVTVEEHARLGASRSSGWARYIDAGIRVRDMRTGEEVDLNRFADPLGGRTASTPVEEEEVPEGFVLGAGMETVLAQLSTEAAPRVRELVRSLQDEPAVLMPGLTRNGRIADTYCRLHDAALEEPSPAVAYIHYNGSVSLRLNEDEIPTSFIDMHEVSVAGHPRYGVHCQLIDDTSVEVAEELIRLALEQMRTEETL